MDSATRIIQNAILPPRFGLAFQRVVKGHSPVLRALRVRSRKRGLKGIEVIEQVHRTLGCNLRNVPVDLEARLTIAVSALAQVIRLLSLDFSHRTQEG